MSYNNSNDDSDISNGGALEALQDIGLDINTASAENKENQNDKNATKSITTYDANNRLLIDVDNSPHGANIEDLKRFSKLHHRTKSNNDKHGYHDIGAKAYTAYFTNLFKDENSNELNLDPTVKAILAKQPNERTPLEILQSTVTVISKTDEYDRLNETELNQITLDFISPIYNGSKYKNEPKQATPLSTILWNKFSINPNKPGTIVIVPVSKKRHYEFIDYLLSKDIYKNHMMFLSKTYNYYLSENTEMVVKFIKLDIKKCSSNITVDYEDINIPSLNTNILKAVSYDPLHFTKIDNKNKMTAYIDIYEKNEENAASDEEINKPKLMVLVTIDGAIKKITRNEKGEPVSTAIAKKEIENETTNYSKICQIKQLGAYNDEWSQMDLTIYKKIYGDSIRESEVSNLSSSNGHYFARNNKITDKIEPPIKNSGDFSVRNAYAYCRFLTSYSSCMDKFAPPLIKKSEIKYTNWPQEIRDAINWTLKNFRNKIGKMYKNNNKMTVPTHTSIRNIVIDDNDSEDTASTSGETSLTSDNDDIDEESVDNDNSIEEGILASSSTNESENVTQNMNSINCTNENIHLDIDLVAAASNEINQTAEIIPSAVTRSANTAEYVTRNQFEDAINEWYLLTDKHNELNEANENLFRVNNLINKDIFDDIYNKLNIITKIEIIKKYFKKIYPIGDEKVNGGIAFIRAYRENI